ncbi:DUF6916 family protein [Endothiovibrio diazotrophicus]
MDLSKITHADFEKCVEQEFTCTVNNGQMKLTLTQVRMAPADRKAPDAKREPFSVFFKGEPTQYAPQATYNVKNDTFGDADIFIVPVAEDDKDCVTYQAVFN